MQSIYVKICVGLGLALLILSILTGAFALNDNGLPILNPSKLSQGGWLLLFLGAFISFLLLQRKNAKRARHSRRRSFGRLRPYSKDASLG
ncbi:MAG: hypothetical protein JWS10_3420 [Cypionkella sp.]|nr:hypothetical protein [Cypionkella sp.]